MARTAITACTETGDPMLVDLSGESAVALVRAHIDISPTAAAILSDVLYNASAALLVQGRTMRRLAQTVDPTFQRVESPDMVRAEGITSTVMRDGAWATI